MPASVQTLGLADAMFSLESPSWDGQPLFPERMAWGYAAWNSSASINQRCLKAHSASGGQHCMYGGAVASFITTPMFVLNSK